MDEPYFNLHGGGPGRAPAMTKDFHAPNGRAAFDRLNDPDYRYRSKRDEKPNAGKEQDEKS